MLLIFTPFAKICLTGIGMHGGFPLKKIIPKFSLEHASLLHQHAPSMFFIVQKLSSVRAAIEILCCPLAIRQVVLPLTFIGVARDIGISTVSVSHSVTKISLVKTAIRLDEPPLTLTTPLEKLPFEVVAAIKVQDTVAMRYLVDNFSLVMSLQSLNIHLQSGIKVVGLRDRGELLKTRPDSISQI